ncbi:hypothetical protein QQZ08_004389 [Neonectria magnoliae]|uniref:Uncharacterized protein n=1 Tax=Neonectria magnoliae TaxID=2732573 RepID=A0ABR1I6H8_9HYPO
MPRVCMISTSSSSSSNNSNHNHNRNKGISNRSRAAISQHKATNIRYKGIRNRSKGINNSNSPILSTVSISNHRRAIRQTINFHNRHSSPITQHSKPILPAAINMTNSEAIISISIRAWATSKLRPLHRNKLPKNHTKRIQHSHLLIPAAYHPLRQLVSPTT